MKRLLQWTTVFLLSSLALAQNATPGSPTPNSPSQPAVTAADIQALKDALAAQQQQIQQLQRALAERDQTAPARQPEAQPAETPHLELASSVSASPASIQNPPSVQAAQVLQGAQGVEAGSSDQRIRNLERQIKGLGPINFS